VWEEVAARGGASVWHALLDLERPRIAEHAALLVGNLCRMEERCVTVVESGVAEMLAGAASQPGLESTVLAALSALRNVGVPARTRAGIVRAGAIEVVLPSLSARAPQVRSPVEHAFSPHLLRCMRTCNFFPVCG
jgi:hypothetical protein